MSCSTQYDFQEPLVGSKYSDDDEVDGIVDGIVEAVDDMPIGKLGRAIYEKAKSGSAKPRTLNPEFQVFLVAFPVILILLFITSLKFVNQNGLEISAWDILFYMAIGVVVFFITAFISPSYEDTDNLYEVYLKSQQAEFTHLSIFLIPTLAFIIFNWIFILYDIPDAITLFLLGAAITTVYGDRENPPLAASVLTAMCSFGLYVFGFRFAGMPKPFYGEPFDGLFWLLLVHFLFCILISVFLICVRFLWKRIF